MPPSVSCYIDTGTKMIIKPAIELILNRTCMVSVKRAASIHSLMLMGFTTKLRKTDSASC